MGKKMIPLSSFFIICKTGGIKSFSRISVLNRTKSIHVFCQLKDTKVMLHNVLAWVWRNSNSPERKHPFLSAYPGLGRSRAAGQAKHLRPLSSAALWKKTWTLLVLFRTLGSGTLVPLVANMSITTKTKTPAKCFPHLFSQMKKSNLEKWSC